MARTTILLVDDDEVLRHTLAITLEEHGYDVTTAASVPEALKLITAGRYDVLLSDLHMPGRGDGLTVVSAMRHANPGAVANDKKITAVSMSREQRVGHLPKVLIDLVNRLRTFKPLGSRDWYRSQQNSMGGFAAGRVSRLQ
jgi:CheY-like chemotaxis protein